MRSLKKEKQTTHSQQFFTIHDDYPKSRIQILSSFTDINHNHDRTFFITSQVKRQIVKSAQKGKKLRQLNSPTTKNKNQQADTDFSSTLYPKLFNPQDNLLNQQASIIKSKLLLTIQNERNLLNKITIHRIRNQRQTFQSQTKKLQNKYNYFLNQIQKQKKKSLSNTEKLMRIKHIQQQSKKQKQFIQTEKHNFIIQNLTQKSRLRQKIISQKQNKHKRVIDLYNTIHENASRIRFQSNQIEQDIHKFQTNQIENKKIKYFLEKKREQNMLQNRQKILQEKMMKAQNQFKMKWLKQFNQSSQARKNYLRKRQILGRKMEKLYEQMSASNTIQIKEEKRNKSEMKLSVNEGLNSNIF